MKPEADKKYLKSMLIIHYAALGLCPQCAVFGCV